MNCDGGPCNAHIVNGLSSSSVIGHVCAGNLLMNADGKVVKLYAFFTVIAAKVFQYKTVASVANAAPTGPSCGIKI